MSDIVLHGYWRSSAAYRVRIALNLKGIPFRQVTHDLRNQGQRDPAYLELAPHGLVPAIEYKGKVLIETPAILEWLEQRWPTPALLPPDPDDAAVVRAMAALVACDIHPLANLRVLETLRSDFDATPEQVLGWIERWIGGGFAALETLIARHGAGFAFGEKAGLADCFLVPQLYNARRYDLDLAAFPHLVAAGDAAASLPAFRAAHPDRQPDAATPAAP